MTAAVLNFKSHLSELFAQALRTVAPGQAAEILLERPKQAQHGDYACNLAMQLAKPLRRSPRDIAQALIAALPKSDVVEKVEIAGAGFINVFITTAAKQRVVCGVLQAGGEYGRIALGAGIKIQIEFVSANPTGPLHVGHGRGAAYGASLSNVLDAAGYKVSREYYVNDAGRQMDILALSVWLRYLHLYGVKIPFPPNAYQGDYVRDMARQISAAHDSKYVHALNQQLIGDLPQDSDPDAHLDALIAEAKRLLGDDYRYVHNYALTEQLGDCRNDLAEFGVHFDEWFSEQSLFDSGLVARVVEQLKAAGHLYEQDGALWFRSTDFGDEKDRVVQRENGLYTYFASDIAYHLNKFERFDRVINIWGADHHGYIARVKGALTALGQDSERLAIALVQFAVLYRDGQKASMSTRSGEFVTLRELRKEVGNDATRFFYVLRKSDQHLDFDMDLAKSQSNENPVYYIQYAHARICSVLAQWDGDAPALLGADVSVLDSAYEQTLLQRLIDYPQVIESAAQDLAPHIIAFYLKDLAADFHSYYNASRFLVEDERIKRARLALIAATARVMNNGLSLLGVAAPEKM
ncbi:MAG: arginine--tRNA ligase [Nitrosomonadales bacterium]|nr:arginine--tRNA ligase [Nitrosomonadales bacterium]